VTILDANILLYRYDAGAPQHGTTRRWLDTLLATPDWIGIPWVSMWAFLRISTNTRLARHPPSAHDSFEILRDLLAQPRVMIVEPGPRHAEILEMVMTENQVSGPLVTDAVLAAIALEQGATLASTDRGFARFKQLDWVNPLDLDT
jgi:toxin-antitoxin system PIN domain toxin